MCGSPSGSREHCRTRPPALRRSLIRGQKSPQACPSRGSSPLHRLFSARRSYRRFPTIRGDLCTWAFCPPSCLPQPTSWLPVLSLTLSFPVLAEDSRPPTSIHQHLPYHPPEDRCNSTGPIANTL